MARSQLTLRKIACLTVCSNREYVMTALDKPTLRLEMPVTLRLATYNDLPKLEWYGQYTHFRALFRRTYQDQLQHQRLMLVADCNNFPIGHVFIQLNHSDQRVSDGRKRAYFYS